MPGQGTEPFEFIFGQEFPLAPPQLSLALVVLGKPGAFALLPG
jgi:hypothetical protein